MVQRAQKSVRPGAARGRSDRATAVGLGRPRCSPRLMVGLVVLVALAGGTRSATAQEQTAAAPAAEESPSPKVVDVGDLWRWVRHRMASAEGAASGPVAARPFFFISPSVSSKPSTGLSVGISSSVVFFAG